MSGAKGPSESRCARGGGMISIKIKDRWILALFEDIANFPLFERLCECPKNPREGSEISVEEELILVFW